MEIQGIVKAIMPEVKINDKFTKRELVVQTADQYPQEILLQVTQGKCSLLDGLKEYDEVKVQFNLNGKSWTSPAGEIKWFNSLNIWKIEVVSKGEQPSEQEEQWSDSNVTGNQAPPPTEMDPLPF